MTTPRGASPLLATHSATPFAQTRTASYVYSSAIRARHPSVPKTILGISTSLAGRHGGPRGARTPMLERVGERAAERDGRPPAGAGAEGGRIEREHGRLARTHALRVDLQPERYPGERDERVEQLRDGHEVPGADVVRLGPLRRELEGGRVRRRHVSHVQEVPLRVEPAVADHR